MKKIKSFLFCKNCNKEVRPTIRVILSGRTGTLFQCPSCGLTLTAKFSDSIKKRHSRNHKVNIRKKIGRLRPHDLGIYNCEFCNRNEREILTLDKHYLEIHHITERNMGGTDTSDNVIVLCTNCHKLVHYIKGYCLRNNRNPDLPKLLYFYENNFAGANLWSYDPEMQFVTMRDIEDLENLQGPRTTFTTLLPWKKGL